MILKQLFSVQIARIHLTVFELCVREKKEEKKKERKNKIENFTFSFLNCEKN